MGVRVRPCLVHTYDKYENVVLVVAFQYEVQYVCT